MATIIAEQRDAFLLDMQRRARCDRSAILQPLIRSRSCEIFRKRVVSLLLTGLLLLKPEERTSTYRVQAVQRVERGRPRRGKR